MAQGTKAGRRLVLAGCAFLLVVVLTHVAEHFNVLPMMGWGLPDSPGHYLDLLSAIAGVGLVVIGLALRVGAKC
jgi:hypothetical protein